MSKADVLWALIGIVLSIVSYLVGWAKDRWGLPKPIARLLANKEVMDLIADGVGEAAALAGRSDAERQEYVRSWAKTELLLLLGDEVPDSAINFLIERVVVGRKVVE